MFSCGADSSRFGLLLNTQLKGFGINSLIVGFEFVISLIRCLMRKHDVMKTYHSAWA